MTPLAAFRFLARARGGAAAWIFLLLLGLPPVLRAQLEWVPDDAPPAVFGGADRTIRVMFRNPTDHPVETDFRTRLFQASSATVMPLGPAESWKKVRVLAGQTSLESAKLPFPEVKAGTLVLVRWLDDRGGALGPTRVMVYPTNLCHALKALAGKEPVGCLDPLGQIKPLLRRSGVGLQDLEETSPEDFHGKLAIIGPFDSEARAPDGLAKRIKLAARAGLAVLWLQPPSSRNPGGVDPPALVRREGAGAVVVWPTKPFPKLDEEPLVQLRIIRLASVALNPEEYEQELMQPTP